MRAVVVRRRGGPEVLESAVCPIGRPAAGELLIQVAAAGINFTEIHQRQGVAPYHNSVCPFIPGSEGAGIVTAVGAGVTEVNAGDRVAWWVPGCGSYAEQVIVPAHRTVPVPAALDLQVAAAVLVQGLTAHYLASSVVAVNPGDWVLIHAAAGGVGSLLTQMIKQRGGLVIATASTEEKRALALQAGALMAVDYQNASECVREATGGAGVSTVYDSVGQATAESSFASLRPRGMLVLYGASSGRVAPLDLQQLAALGSLYVTHPALRHYVATRTELLARASQLFSWVLQTALTVRIEARFPLDEAKVAHEALAARRTMGKLLLIPFTG